MRHDATAVNGQPAARATRMRSGILHSRRGDTTNSPTFAESERGLFFLTPETGDSPFCGRCDRNLNVSEGRHRLNSRIVSPIDPDFLVAHFDETAPADKIM